MARSCFMWFMSLAGGSYAPRLDEPGSLDQTTNHAPTEHEQKHGNADHRCACDVTRHTGDCSSDVSLSRRDPGVHQIQRRDERERDQTTHHFPTEHEQQNGDADCRCACDVTANGRDDIGDVSASRSRYRNERHHEGDRLHCFAEKVSARCIEPVFHMFQLSTCRRLHHRNPTGLLKSGTTHPTTYRIPKNKRQVNTYFSGFRKGSF